MAELPEPTSIPGPPVSFVRATSARGTRTGKDLCTVCGRRGYPDGSWKDACRRGHLPCRNGCGRLMSALINGAARRHPSHRCPAISPDIKWPSEYRQVNS